MTENAQVPQLQDPAELRLNADLLSTLAQNLRSHADSLAVTQTHNQTTLESVKSLQLDLQRRITVIENVMNQVVDLFGQLNQINEEINKLKADLNTAQQDIDSAQQGIAPQHTPKRTVVCHFFNEEFLLPWWLRHHKHIFDHGIMIDYASTDRSCELIREICPSWEIRPSRNQFFTSVEIDQEVMDIESTLEGWRMTLNVTEFLYGNTDHLNGIADYTQFLIGNYVLVDMNDPNTGPINLDHNIPLLEQRYWGYDEFANTGTHKGGQMGRMHRSIHNHPVSYSAGRHFGGKEKSFNDLVIFYVGHASASPEGIQRKTQISAKVGDREPGSTHHKSEQEYRNGFDQLRTLSRDLRGEITHILEHNRRVTGQNW